MTGLFDEPSKHPLPQPDLRDVRVAVGKGLVSMIPLLGGPGSELIALLAAPVARRRDDWLTDLERRLRGLENKVDGFRFDNLANNDQFVSATLQATQAALKTHEQEKLKALRNAVLNVAAGNVLDEARQTAFLALIDRFQPAHLRILQEFRNYPQSGKHNAWQDSIRIQNPGTPTRWIKDFVPGLRDEDTEFIRMLITDIYNAGLSFISPDDQNVPNNGRWITSVGIGFLNFIS